MDSIKRDGTPRTYSLKQFEKPIFPDYYDVNGGIDTQEKSDIYSAQQTTKTINGEMDMWKALDNKPQDSNKAPGVVEFQKKGDLEISSTRDVTNKFSKTRIGQEKIHLEFDEKSPKQEAKNFSQQFHNDIAFHYASGSESSFSVDGERSFSIDKEGRKHFSEVLKDANFEKTEVIIDEKNGTVTIMDNFKPHA